MTLAEAITLIDTPQLRALAVPPATRPAGSLSADPDAPDATPSPQTWADLGCGSGLFTHALGHFLPAGSTIYAIDLQPIVAPQTTPIHIIPRQLNFVTANLGLNNLDGILMANSLHYVKDQPAFLKRLKTYLKPDHTLVLIEYDTDRPVATWVPYPLSFASLQSLFQQAGYTQIQKIAMRPSAYGRSNIYSALIQ